jgi:hypothetical protein
VIIVIFLGMGILFTPEDHRYIREEDGCRLMSASHFYRQFDDTDWEAALSRKAVQIIFGPTRYEKLKKAWNAQGGHIYQPEYITYLEAVVPNQETYLELREKFRKEWRESGNVGAGKGTGIHEDKEAEDILNGYAIQHSTGEVFKVMPHGKKEDGTNCSVVDCLLDLPDGFYGELLLWYYFPHKVYSQSLGYEICGLCGTADRVFLKNGVAVVEDYKTNAKLSSFSIKIPNYGIQYHLPPFNHLRKSDVSKYHIQLNVYGWLLQQHGFRIDDLRLLHVPEGEVIKEIPVPYEGSLVDEAVSNLLNSSL